ncbi:probable low-specificity L-threonine aldolase 2 [Portunus trituberculatus]|uniref:probable low-specificity L-threonine aldolase 2 n=1 Tax=Portunus trituberculatus TaxID=210409 RepID=UPI001E1D11B9|nr:probable low-specificity L-threonine aldolase 2 [Portunus trituberculatus]
MAPTTSSDKEAVVVVDLRSDTLTQPSALMKQAMVEAPLGDDVFGEDPTVIALQKKVAALLGKEDALFVPTGTMSNLVAVLTHCQQRGSEVILGDQSHIHLYEQGGISQLGGVHPRTVRNLPDGTFDLHDLRRVVRSDNEHFPVSALVCVENTHNVAGGKVVPLDWMDELGATCRQLGLPLHMDGARLLNAATALDLPPARLVRSCTTISLCLSKGLGAPVGSVLAGPQDFIKRARRTRKAVGGGMRQAGVVAAAGIFALDHVYPALGRDHRLLQELAQAVEGCGSKVIRCDPRGAHTNILLVECDPSVVTPEALCERMGQATPAEVTSLGEHVIVRILPLTDSKARLVLHCDVTPGQVQSAARKLRYVIKELDSEC